MSRLVTSFIVALCLCLSVPCLAQDAAADFAGAKWIAMDSDSTIVFPHKHLLRPRSELGQSLKAYRLPVLSKDVQLRDGRIRRAWVDVCGMGQYELFVSGRKVGDYFLTPGWTMYNRQMLYNEFDVTDILNSQPSNLKLQVMLGGGMYDIPLKGYHKMGGSCGAPKLLLCLHIDYEDGESQTVVSDETWTASPSPVRYASIYAGEWYDASFLDSMSVVNDRPCVVTRPYWDAQLLRQQPGTFIRISRELPMTQLNDSLYDMRQNCSGIVRLKVRGQHGQTIRLHPAEVLKDGKVYQRCMPGYEWKYTLQGCQDVEVWQPQFSYTGFRYVEVVADEGIELLELTGLHTTTDAPEVGSFECSDTLLNQIHTLIDWAIRSNLTSITTDCPTREKLGWQEQNHLMAYSMMYRYDMRALMNKVADDLAASQHADGAIPTIAPEYVTFDAGSGFEDTPEWGASFILCPWYTYLWYGDDSALRKHYDAMKRYVDYLLSRAEDGILDYGLGDWYDIGPERPGKAQLTSVALSATAMLYYELTTMLQIARHLDNASDAQYFEQTAQMVKQAFNRRFATGDARVYENGSQTALAMALYMDLVTDSTRQQALDALVNDIRQRGYALTAGDVGFRYVVQALQQNGRSDIIYLMNSNGQVPGYAYQLRQGATALTESWQAYDNVSNNHLMLGHLMEWLYAGLGGIRPSDSAWSHIIIEPQMVGSVSWTRTSLNTPRGRVECYWTRDAGTGQWTIEILIPDGSDAQVCMPDGRRVTVGSGRMVFRS
ncbi:MAG: family 78 glycoside hydrolase catalytic domain [Prevotella sp.]|nr:family 78 glycoside hydrolase catalytic domain [Prevotella sp.]